MVKSQYELVLPKIDVIYARNCPRHIRQCAHLPWHYVGDMEPELAVGGKFNCPCHKCKEYLSCVGVEWRKKLSSNIVTLVGHRFVTEDRMIITVYFGQCHDCQSVYWAKQFRHIT